jgi:hypothetical protein
MRTFSHTPPAPEPACLMQLTVDADAVTALRQMVVSVCGDGMEFMRIAACDHGRRMKVWLCVGKAFVAQIMALVMRALPDAEFGLFSGPGPRRVALRPLK